MHSPDTIRCVLVILHFAIRTALTLLGIDSTRCSSEILLHVGIVALQSWCSQSHICDLKIKDIYHNLIHKCSDS